MLVGRIKWVAWSLKISLRWNRLNLFIWIALSNFRDGLIWASYIMILLWVTRAIIWISSCKTTCFVIWYSRIDILILILLWRINMKIKWTIFPILLLLNWNFSRIMIIIDVGSNKLRNLNVLSFLFSLFLRNILTILFFHIFLQFRILIVLF